MTKYQSLVEIVGRLRKEPTGACIPWDGSRAHHGYGILSKGGKGVFAHRVALELNLGRPLLPGMFALHACHNRPCINPAHLYEGTLQDRLDKMVAAGRSTTGEKNGRRTKPECGPRGDKHGKSVKSAALRANLAEMAATRDEGTTYVALEAHYGVGRTVIRGWYQAYTTGHYKINPVTGRAEFIDTKAGREKAWKELQKGVTK